MAKRSGIGELAIIGGYSIGGDVGSYSYGGPMAVLDVTGLDKSAHERIGGVRDGRLSMQTFFDPEEGQAFERLSALPTTNVDVMFCHGQTLGQPAAFMRGLQTNYDLNRTADGGLTFGVEVVSGQTGINIGELLTAGIRTESAATNGTGVDFGDTESDFGLTFAVHVVALGSGSPTIKLQDSDDDDTYADITGATAGVVAAHGTYLVSTAKDETIRQYVRVISTGTFTGLSFVAAFQRHLAATL